MRQARPKREYPAGWRTVSDNQVPAAVHDVACSRDAVEAPCDVVPRARIHVAALARQVQRRHGHRHSATQRVGRKVEQGERRQDTQRGRQRAREIVSRQRPARGAASAHGSRQRAQRRARSCICRGHAQLDNGAAAARHAGEAAIACGGARRGGGPRRADRPRRARRGGVQVAQRATCGCVVASSTRERGAGSAEQQRQEQQRQHRLGHRAQLGGGRGSRRRSALETSLCRRVGSTVLKVAHGASPPPRWREDGALSRGATSRGRRCPHGPSCPAPGSLTHGDYRGLRRDQLKTCLKPKNIIRDVRPSRRLGTHGARCRATPARPARRHLAPCIARPPTCAPSDAPAPRRPVLP